MLGLEANRPVTADRLIEGLWGEEPPASAAKMVQHYVWRLRKALADEDAGAEIVTRGRAYELRIDRDQVDACRLERLVGEAARAGAAPAARRHPAPGPRAGRRTAARPTAAGARGGRDGAARRPRGGARAAARAVAPRPGAGHAGRRGGDGQDPPRRRARRRGP